MNSSALQHNYYLFIYFDSFIKFSFSLEGVRMSYFISVSLLAVKTDGSVIALETWKWKIQREQTKEKSDDSSTSTDIDLPQQQ